MDVGRSQCIYINQRWLEFIGGPSSRSWEKADRTDPPRGPRARELASGIERRFPDGVGCAGMMENITGLWFRRAPAQP
jgi:hypothetical protein